MATENGDDVAALGALLQAYPGLLSGRVEEVARALTQATLAAAQVSAQYAGARSGSATAQQRVRLGAALSAEAASASASAGAAAARSTAGVDRDAAHGARRRWLTSGHLQQMQMDGVVFTKGKFTDGENAAIDSAVSDFVCAHGLTRQELYHQLFRRQTGQATGDKQLRRAFWPVLAETLPARQLQAIYHHVRRKYHPYNYQGAWSAAEDDALRALVAAHGPAWETISQQLGRMGTNCRDRWRYIQASARRADDGA
ncbi:RNA polymerase I enhancer binding protein [Coemansia sp. RSA 1721]|nr:RNA polymerase I enhancer binding protein [Coemansia sp. RSA 1721]